MAARGSRKLADEPRGLGDESHESPDGSRPSPRSQGSSAARGRLRYAIAVAATIIIVAFLLGRYGDGFARAVARAHPAWIGAALAMATGMVLLVTLRWRLVVRAMHYPLGFGRALSVVLAASPLALVTPSRAGDFARAFAVRDEVPLAAGTGSVLAEKAVDMAILLALAAGGAALEGLWIWSAVIAAALAVEVAAVALLMAQRARFKQWPIVRAHTEKVDDVLLAFDALRRAPAMLAWTSLASLAIRLLTLAITFALLRGLDADVGLFDTCALFPVAVLIGLVPVTLGGMGTRDATFIYLLSLRGQLVTRANVLAATMGYSAIALGVFALVGAPFMVRESGRALGRRTRT